MPRCICYPDGFVQRVKAAFPEPAWLHVQLEVGGVASVETFLQQHERADLLAEFNQIWQTRPIEPWLSFALI